MTDTLTPAPDTTPQAEEVVAPARRVTPMKVLLSLAVVLLAGGVVTTTSLALFTDTASVDGNTFTTGSVDINATPATAVVSSGAMAPGDQTTAPLTVSNGGTLALRYAVESTTTENVLASELVMTIKSGVTSCTNANWTATGTTLYSGRLGSTGGDAIIGSAAQGAQAGDRTLTAGNSEVLCINVTLPLSATVGEGVTTEATLDFLAEQTSNNP